ncbi:MAG: DUF3999 domain-containing protein [Proteobacteria bacterium]|nr:DUF3999 domain-containing protein [Pseudomonadota bacterium]
MKKYFILSIFFLGIVGTSFAKTVPRPEMFAYGMQLEVSGDNAFYELEIPLEIYQKTTRRDLGDVRVFNGSGQVVPHALRRPGNITSQKDIIYKNLPFFPIKGELDNKTGGLSVHVEKNEEGTIVDVKAPSRRDASKEEKTLSYLVDASALKEPIYAIELSWSDAEADFFGIIIVDSSDDLTNWRSLVTETVARLGYQGYRLDRNKIILNNCKAKYLRFSWAADQTPIDLTKVALVSRISNTVENPARRWLTPQVIPVSGEPGKYLVDLKGFLHVDRIRIRLPENNAMAGLRLSSGDSSEGPMKEHWRGLVYNLDFKGDQIFNSPVIVRSTAQRYWMIVTEESESEINGIPVLEFGWQARRLVFLAQGSGPFQIAYGSRSVEPTSFHIDALLNKYKASVGRNITPRLLTHSSEFIIGGEKQLKPLPSVWPWKKYILWTIMFAGVFVIGWMSILLYRQLQIKDNNEEAE